MYRLPSLQTNVTLHVMVRYVLAVCFRQLMPLLIEIRFTMICWSNCFPASFALSMLSVLTYGLPSFYTSFLPFRPSTFHWLQFQLPTCVVAFLNSFGQGIPKYVYVEVIAMPGPHGVAHTLELFLCFCDWVHAAIWVWKWCLDPSYNYVYILLLALWEGSIVMLLILQIRVLFLFLMRWFCVKNCLFYPTLGYRLICLLQSLPTLLVFPYLFVCLFVCLLLLPSAHIHPMYLVCPSVLILIGECLLAEGCGSLNHT